MSGVPFYATGMGRRFFEGTLPDLVSALARLATASFEEAVRAECDARACYFTQNDGTLMAVNYARRYPSLMLASGPANSMRGAAYLSGALASLSDVYRRQAEARLDNLPTILTPILLLLIALLIGFVIAGLMSPVLNYIHYVTGML